MAIACVNPVRNRIITAWASHEIHSFATKPMHQRTVQTWVRTITSSTRCHMPAVTFGTKNDTMLNNARAQRPRKTSREFPNSRPTTKSSNPDSKPPSTFAVHEPASDFKIEGFVDRSRKPQPVVDESSTPQHPAHEPKKSPKPKAPTPSKPKWEDRRELWAIQKSALGEKFPEGWQPRKKLSPETMQGIRDLHEGNAATYTTPVLADMFKVSPEVIRRILKSKWMMRMSPEDREEKKKRWAKRGERIWDAQAEIGLRPPRKREMPLEDPDKFDQEMNRREVLGKQ